MTPEGFHREMIGWLVGQGLALITLMAGLVKWLLSREEERLLSKMQSTVSAGFEHHNGDVHAHRKVVDDWEVKRDRRLDAILLHVGDSIEGKLRDAMADVMTKHNADAHAHPEGSEHRINPLLALIDKLDNRLDSIERKLDDLAAEHRAIAGRCVTEDRMKGRQ